MLLPFDEIDLSPLASSDADTDTAVPVSVEPVIHPVEFVTDGVTDIE